MVWTELAADPLCASGDHRLPLVLSPLPSAPPGGSCAEDRRRVLEVSTASRAAYPSQRRGCRESGRRFPARRGLPLRQFAARYLPPPAAPPTVAPPQAGVFRLRRKERGPEGWQRMKRSGGPGCCRSSWGRSSGGSTRASKCGRCARASSPARAFAGGGGRWPWGSFSRRFGLGGLPSLPLSSRYLLSDPPPSVSLSPSSPPSSPSLCRSLENSVSRSLDLAVRQEVWIYCSPRKSPPISFFFFFQNYLLGQTSGKSFPRYLFALLSPWINVPFVQIVQPGPREFPLQCLIKRNKKNSTFYLYLCLNQCKSPGKCFREFLPLFIENNSAWTWPVGCFHVQSTYVGA